MAEPPPSGGPPSSPPASAPPPASLPPVPGPTPLPAIRPSRGPSLGTPTSAPPAPSARGRRIFLWISAIGATLLLIVSSEVLLPFVLGLLVAYILLPAVLRVERLRVPRWAAILLVYAVTLGAVGGFFALIVPSIIGEAQALRRELPRQIEQAQAKWIPALDARLEQWLGPGASADEEPEAAPAPTSGPPGPDAALVVRPSADGSLRVEVGPNVQLRRVGEEVWKIEHVEPEQGGVSAKHLLEKATGRATKYVAENTVELIRIGQQIVSAISRGVFNLFMTLMLGGYIMLTHERILGFFRELFSLRTQPAFDRMLHRLDRGLSGVVRGQLLICLVNGVLSAIGFWLFDLKYWPIMSLLAAIGSIIPIFGSILSTIPAVAIGLTQSPGTAFAVLAWVVGIHQLEANFLNPKIIGDAAKIHPVLVVFSLLVGEHFFQIKGALFAVPCLSIVQTVFLHFRETTMGLADPTATDHPDLMPGGPGGLPPDEPG